MSSAGIIFPTGDPAGRDRCSTKCDSWRMRSDSGRPIRRTLDTFDYLFTEPVVLVRPTRLWREGEDRLTVSRTLLQPDALGDRRLENAISENLADGLLDVARKRRAAVVQRNHGPKELEIGIRARADLLHGLEQVVGTLECKVA